MPSPSAISIRYLDCPKSVTRGSHAEILIQACNSGERDREIRIRLQYRGPLTGEWRPPDLLRLPPGGVAEARLSLPIPCLAPPGLYEIGILLEDPASREIVAEAGLSLTIVPREGETYEEALGATLLAAQPDPASRERARRWALEAIDRGEHLCDVLRNFTRIERCEALILGCGEGGEAIALARRGARVVATDLGWQAVERTKIRARECGVHLEARVADAQDLASLGERFDLIILAEVIEHVRDPARAAAAVAGALHPAGIVYLSTPNKLSLRNFLSESHSQLFGASLLPRPLYHFYVKKVRRSPGFGDVELLAPRTLRRIFARHGVPLERLPLASYECRAFLARWRHSPRRSGGWQGLATRLLKALPFPERWALALYEYLWAIDSVYIGRRSGADGPSAEP